jgi:hypothetical protein
MNKILSILVLAIFVFSGCVEDEPHVEEIPTRHFINEGAHAQTGVISGENIVASVQSAGSITLSGTCNFAEITVRSAGAFYGSNLETREAVVNSLGAGHTYIWVTGRLNVNIEGAGSVYYKGNPQIISNLRGAGKLIKQ